MSFDVQPKIPPWMDGAAVLVAGAAVLVTYAVATTTVVGIVHPAVALTFCGLIAFGEAIRLRLPDERVQAPIGLAGALGYALLVDLPGEVTAAHSVAQVVGVTAIGMLIGTMPHLVAGRPAELEGIARRLLVVAMVAVVFRGVILGDLTGQWLESHPALLVAATVGTVVLVWPAEAVLVAGVKAGRRVGPFLALLRDELIAYLGIGLAIASTGVLIALATAEIGLWALPVVSVPLMLAQYAYRRYAGIRRTQGETIRALSRATEVGGYTESGHARRVAGLALAIGRDLGLPEQRLRFLQYAALMHDLGQLSLADPIPGGATVLLPPDERCRLAERGAEVIRQTGVPEAVADIVQAQAEPYRRPHVPDDGQVPQESRIVKVVNAYDDLVGSSEGTDSRLDALETLRLQMAYEYDPRVVASLARVLERAGRTADRV